jgi:hypothetical protein
VGSVDCADGFWLCVDFEFCESNGFVALNEILDLKLLQRQQDWHELLLPNGTVLVVDEQREICHFAYKSPWPIADRDTLYVKEKVESKEKELKLLYWTFADPNIGLLNPKFVAIEFQAAHHIVATEAGARYRYIQKSDPKIHLPDFLLKSIQVGILEKEIGGLKKAIAMTTEK